MPLVRLLLGRTLPNRRSEERKLTALTGVPAMGLDGLGSSAYGPEAALTVLIPLGTIGIAHIGPIAVVIVALLAIDYVLNVAVGISAGVGALASAVPSLHPYTLELCLAILLGITVVNLRGTLDAGRLFAAPTYLFVASFFLLLAIGGLRALATGGAPAFARGRIPPLPPLTTYTKHRGLRQAPRHAAPSRS